MAQKKQSVFDRLSELALALIVEEAVRRSREKVYRFFRKMVFAVAITVVGLVFVITGLIYTTLGIVKLIEIVVPGWAAFIIVGVILLGGGYALSRMAFR